MPLKGPVGRWSLAQSRPRSDKDPNGGRYWVALPWWALITAQRKPARPPFVGNLCRSLINGGPFLGCFDVRAVDGDIALLNYEMPALQLAQWLDSMQIPREAGCT